MNKLILMGNLCHDIELRHTPKGTPVAQSSIAVNRRWTTESGEKREEVMFLDFTAFSGTAEVMAKYLKKGAQVVLEGRLALEQWDDKQSGSKRSKHKLIVESFYFTGGSTTGERDAGGHAPRPAFPHSNAQSARARAAKAASTGDGGAPEDDDVPF